MVSALFLAGCPTPFTYSITKSTLDAGIRNEHAEEFHSAIRTAEKTILKYSTNVRVPSERDGEIEFRWAVWDTKELRSDDDPEVSVKSSSVNMDGDPIEIVSMNRDLLQALEDKERERFASVSGQDLFWVGNGAAKHLSGLDRKDYRLFWGYLAQGSVPLAVVADIFTYPIQWLGGIMTCSVSGFGFRDPRC